ncbi:hypothetical protein LEL_09723 [Akanthomyces lecanii RCEF 1005]|uniref:Uncharacterized protein n=1 Tax=Akanthomyces lecanii RCEF 1005 TaxID=1081108 RepID=A0A162JMM0_CORDF|nr:hypothetical protein LEL_09723 [Akanthomyces lecanii RCEF 1005]
MSESSENSVDGFLVEDRLLPNTPKSGYRANQTFLRCIPVVWYLASLVIGLLLGVGISSIDQGRNCAREGFWRSHEFETVKFQLDAVWKDKLYNARLVYNSSGDMVRPPSNPEYVGVPTPELDMAWSNILPAVTVWITPEEEKFFSGGKLVYFPEFDLYKGQ